MDYVKLIVGWPVQCLFKFVTPYKRAFSCNDTRLRHPFKRSSVPFVYVQLTGFLLNGIAMLFIEIVNPRKDPKKWTFLGRNIPNWMGNFHCDYSMYIFGDVCIQLLTVLIKYATGRFRPFFITVCEPDVCQGYFKSNAYHHEFQCTSEYKDNQWLMTNMRLSFPSGHASVMMFSMLYFAIYLQQRMTWSKFALLKYSLQFGAILSAVAISVTRVTDFKHHWSDVVVGLLLGALTAFLVARYASNLFTEDTEEKIE